MPEIAEVETVRNTLKQRILNKEIKEVNIRYEKIVKSDLQEFKIKLKGQKIEDILRKGKWLIFILTDHALLSHLRMEGKYYLKQKQQPILKHEHIIFTFTDDTDLRYHDTRKFGVMVLTDKDKYQEYEGIKKQGVEPLEKKLTKEYLLEKMKKKTIPIKTLLLDQTIISGLGNIYADEVLFKSKINPLKRGCDLTLEECESIRKSAKEIIVKAIKEGGTTIRSYTSSLGVTGRFQQYLMVHKREGLPCLICNEPITRVKVGGRSTYFCKNCQR